MPAPILLVNTNITKPPVSPVGLEYVGEALIEDQLPVRILDLSFVGDWKSVLSEEIQNHEPIAVGISVRNTDDCSFITRKSFLPWISDVVAEVRKQSRSLVVFGGAGFSVMPEAILKLTKADVGIVGDAEETMVALVRRLSANNDFRDLPNLVYSRGDELIRNKRVGITLNSLPIPRRRLVDNKRYEELGAMVGIETKRGCSQKCVYCADPVVKGRTIRLRPPYIIVTEMKDLLDQGVSWFHLCDSEFNLPINHAKEVCQAIIDAELSSQAKWYCYLLRLGREHNCDTVQLLVRLLKTEGINYIFDLLIGGPGETEGTVRASIDMIRRLDVPVVGISAGVRVYPGTDLAKAISQGFARNALYPKNAINYRDPTYFLSPYLGSYVLDLISDIVGDDSRFLLLSSPSEKGSYNCAGDESLCQIIEDGARGAYWDIISRS
jgi:hypothetical protein